MKDYLFDIFLDFFLVKIEDLCVLKFVLFIVLKDFTVFIHERTLHTFKMFIKDNVLECSNYVIEIDVLR